MSKLATVKKTKKLSDQAYEIIKGAIIKNELKPGEILAEEKLADQLEISRTPIKAALIKLVHENIASVNTNNSIVVSNITAHDVQQVTQVRRCLEELAVSLLENNITKKQINELKKLDKKRCEAAAADEFEEYIEMDFLFHVNIARFTNNSFLAEMVEWVNTIIKRYLILSGTLSKYCQVASKEHKCVLDAIEASDFSQAVTAMSNHLTNVDRRMLIH
ncbi:GntR family transcriptional regulator [Pectinatus sottacetonis]|uniref:GntR family transcriptional regulator n=1 Tax=Pectinatus sottacetonis TaxID=1002795 RepID=UPI0018C55C23|nr:GntR family transcriptional regulator [Pectinatus sottacetonis]